MTDLLTPPMPRRSELLPLEWQERIAEVARARVDPNRRVMRASKNLRDYVTDQLKQEIADD